MAQKRKRGHQKSSASTPAAELRWKPMAIDCAEGLTSEDFAGLVGLEELDVDYATFTGGKVLRGKRIYGGGVDDGDSDLEPEVITASSAAKKKKKKNHNKNKKQKIAAEDEAVSDAAEAEAEDQQDHISISEATTVDLNDPSWNRGADIDPDEPNEPDEDKADPNADLDMSAWSALSVPDHIIAHLRRLRMTTPTPIQCSTIADAITNRQHIYGAAPTGSGKTLAFAIPMVTHIVADKASSSEARLRGLVLTPTRELAVQIKKHIESITKGSSSQSSSTLKTALVVGGLAIQKQERVLSKQKPDIVVATPGRLWEIINSGTVPFLSRSSLSKISYLVIDEADRMVERGHFEELKLVIGLLNETTGELTDQDIPDPRTTRQIFIFSATLTLKKKSKKAKAKKKNSDSDDTPNLIALLRLDQHKLKLCDLTEGGSKSTPSADRLTEHIIHCLKDDKDLYLYYFILANPGRTIVFCNSIDCIRRLVNILRFLGLAPLAVHSSMPQKRRLTSIERFTASAQSLLIATDVAARGLDIPEVNHVLHYQCPRTADIYVHRSGRTARIDQTGTSLILCDPQEEAFFLKDFCRILNKPKDSLKEYVTNSKALAKCKERVKLAQVCDQLEHGLRKERTEDNWFKEAARACEMDDSDQDSDQDPDENGKLRAKSSNSRKLKAYKKQLEALLRFKIAFPK